MVSNWSNPKSFETFIRFADEYQRPILSDDGSLVVKAGRHPIAEKFVTTEFIGMAMLLFCCMRESEWRLVFEFETEECLRMFCTLGNDCYMTDSMNFMVTAPTQLVSIHSSTAVWQDFSGCGLQILTGTNMVRRHLPYFSVHMWRLSIGLRTRSHCEIVAGFSL